MKVALIGDIHISLSSGADAFIKNLDDFFSKVLFPELSKRKIDTILQTGDVFHHRKLNNNLALDSAKFNFFDKMKNKSIDFHVIVGNHDMHLLQKTTPNSLDLYLGEYSNVHIYSEPKTVNIHGVDIDFIPWICESNQEQILNFIAKSKSKICMAHPEIVGFQMSSTFLCEHGLDRETFKNYSYVIAGHFHEPSRYGNIHYIGSPSQHNYGDVGSKRGFYILDTETIEVEFIENPYTMFERIEYFDDMDIKQTPDVANKYVKIILPEKYDVIKYKKFLDEIMSFAPIDVKAIEPAIQLEGETLTAEQLENESFEIVPFLVKYTKSISEDDKFDVDILTEMFADAHKRISEE